MSSTHGNDACAGSVSAAGSLSADVAMKGQGARDALHKQYSVKGVNFVGIAVDTPQNVQGFVGRVHVDYPLVVAGFGGGDLARQFGDAQGALPFTVVIDATGKVRSTTLGQVQPAKLSAVLDAL